ncbi:MAG TPA: hypothetical protein VGR26_01370, partial [Acidimicrobiales bacterium]|nr:hypothetical protein [Acidimicrobiales bacterium]
NTFDGNWGGIVAWENADRFGHDGSANTSKGYTTLLIDPSGAHGTPLMSTCGDPATGGKIGQDPYYSDCRWKTNNLLVSGNTFVAADPAAIGCTSAHCNRHGLFSNFGTYPSWSPYKARVIQEAITFHQNNVWRDNAYTGEWSFVPYEMGNVKSFAEWQAAPYNQDAGSTYGTEP